MEKQNSLLDYASKLPSPPVNKKEGEEQDRGAQEHFKIAEGEGSSPCVEGAVGQSTQQEYNIVTLGEFLKMELPKKEFLLNPLLETQSISMLHAWTGVGKTWVSLTIALAVASGGNVFGLWQAERPFKVTYLDGEMAARSLQERLGTIANNCGFCTDLAMENFSLFAMDLQKTKMPNLATREGQALVMPYIAKAEFVVIDNISTLMNTGKANSEDHWKICQDWLLSLRQKGKTVLLVQHESKSGDNRGTSCQLDIINTQIQLKRPPDYQAEEGARFEVHVRKGRDLYGNNAQALEVKLVNGVWEVKTLEVALEERVRGLAQGGFSMSEIATELQTNKSKIQRICEKHNISTLRSKKSKEQKSKD